jgi:hypothetical protein
MPTVVGTANTAQRDQSFARERGQKNVDGKDCRLAVQGVAHHERRVLDSQRNACFTDTVIGHNFQREIGDRNVLIPDCIVARIFQNGNCDVLKKVW